MDAAQPTLTLREAVNADSAAVRALVARVLSEYGLGWDPAGADADLFDLEASYGRAGGWFGVPAVGMAGPGVVGSVGLRRVDPYTFELRKMYLDSAHRGRGHGRDDERLRVL